MPSQMIARSNVAAGGGGAPVTTAWLTDTFTSSVLVTAGTVITLSVPTNDVDSIMVNYRNGWLTEGDDYSATVSAITLLQDLDPTLNEPATIKIKIKYRVTV